MRGARARAAICAEAQIGAPAQATTCRRGSSARTIKPSRSAAAAKAEADCGVSPMISRARAGAMRQAARARCARGIDQTFERARIGMAEGKADAAGERSITQPMRADGALLPLVSAKAATHTWIPVFTRMSRNQQVRDCETERRHSFGHDHMSRARVGTVTR